MTSEIETQAEARNVIPLRVVALLAFCNVLWAAAAVGSKYALVSFPPLTLTVLRFLPAGLLLLLVVRWQGKLPKIQRADLPYFFALGLIGITITYSLFYTGLLETSASNASLLIACEPIMVAFFARIFLGESLNRNQWFGMLLGLVGIYIIAGNAWGNWVVLLSLCFESTVSVIAKRLAGRYPGSFVVAIEFLIGSALLLPFAIMEWQKSSHHITSEALAGWLYLSLGCSAFCYGVWYRMLERYPVSAMGVLLLVQPMLGPFFGWLLNREQLTARSFYGGALVIFGILITTWRKRANNPDVGSQ